MKTNTEVLEYFHQILGLECQYYWHFGLVKQTSKHKSESYFLVKWIHYTSRLAGSLVNVS